MRPLLMVAGFSGLLCAMLVFLMGCSAGVARSQPATATADDRALACSARALAEASDPTQLPIEVTSGTERVADVRVEGNNAVPDVLVLHGLTTRAGERLRPEALDADLLRLHRLGVFEDIRVAVETTEAGSTVVFRVRERPLIRRVFLAAGSDEPASDQWTAPMAGDLYDAASVHRQTEALRRSWHAEGHLDARVVTHARRITQGRVDLCFELSRGPGWRIGRLSFPGASVVAASELLEVLRRRSSMANQPGAPWRPELLQVGRLELAARLYDHGLVGSKVLQPRITRIPEAHLLHVEIPIEEGRVFHLGKVEVSGKLRAPRSEYARALGLQPGAVFVRSEVLRGFERVQELHRARGGKPELVDRQVETRDAEAMVDLLVKVGG